MADTGLKLDFLESAQREYLRRRAREHNSTIEDELKRVVAEAMDARPPKDLRGIIGMFKGDGTVTGENFHDYLYGEPDEVGRQ